MTSSNSMEALAVAASRLKNWCQHEALPFWLEKGIDPDGGFYERLLVDGTPDREALRRVRVQARLLYCFSHAHSLGWCDGRHAIDHLSTFIETKGVGDPDLLPGEGFKGIAHLLNPDYSVHNNIRDTYAQAFVILGYGWKYKALCQDKDLEIANQMAVWLNKYVASDYGGWEESLPLLPAPRVRRQNPHMHLFEAFIALYDITGTEAYRHLADSVYQLFREYFFDETHGVLLEFFDDKWRPDPETGSLIEPGHLMEWAWLLTQYQRLTGQETLPYATVLFDNAIQIGLNEKTGLLYDEISVDGTITKRTHRSWPLTEHIKASLALSLADPERVQKYAGQAATMIDKLLSTYLDYPLRGAWRDQYDDQGEPVAGPIQASTFYHLFCAAAEAERTVAEL